MQLKVDVTAISITTADDGIIVDIGLSNGMHIKQRYVQTDEPLLRLPRADPPMLCAAIDALEAAARTLAVENFPGDVGVLLAHGLSLDDVAAAQR